MKLVVGLGNPGEKYQHTRHNVGFMVLDALASRVVGGRWSVNRKLHSSLYTVHRPLALAKPQTFMNSSGLAVKKLMVHFKVMLADLWVIHDDLDLTLGSYKIQKGKGPRVHNGLLSIYEKLGTKNFWHVRIGIDNRAQSLEVSRKILGEKYVLQNFTSEEFKVIEGVAEKVTKEMIGVISEDRKTRSTR